MVLFATSILLTCVFSPPISVKCLMVWSTILISIILGSFGMYCHYRGTYGHYAEDHNGLLPLFMFGAIFAAYAVGPLLLTETCAYQMMPRAALGIKFRSLIVTVTWWTLFMVIQVFPGLINSIGVGCVLWFMMINSALAALFYSLILTVVETTKPSKTSQGL